MTGKLLPMQPMTMMTGKLGMNPQTLERITEDGFDYLPEMTKLFKTA